MISGDWNKLTLLQQYKVLNALPKGSKEVHVYVQESIKRWAHSKKKSPSLLLKWKYEGKDFQTTISSRVPYIKVTAGDVEKRSGCFV